MAEGGSDPRALPPPSNEDSMEQGELRIVAGSQSKKSSLSLVHVIKGCDCCGRIISDFYCKVELNS